MFTYKSQVSLIEEYFAKQHLTFSDSTYWTVGEPWAIQALLKFYEQKKLDVGTALVHDAMLDTLQILGGIPTFYLFIL